ncbi:MAG: hypothetical protein RDU14_17045 [Melioribacteraceae bacterium]|nr:hypothetical protein [Melioribacteraceae bacterium]
MTTNNIQIATIGSGAGSLHAAEILSTKKLIILVIEDEQSFVITKPLPINIVLQKSPEKLIIEKRSRKNWERRKY